MCCRLASALSSVSDNDTIIRTVKHRFDERKEARADLWRVTEEARAEKKKRDDLYQAQADRESALQNEVRCVQYCCTVCDQQWS